MGLFGMFSKNFLGIDIGTSAIRVVQLAEKSGKFNLENYAEVPSEGNFSKPFMSIGESSLFLSEENVTHALRTALLQAKITVKKALFSLPDFATFFTTFELPKMNDKEMQDAVRFEAKKYIPVPLATVTLDWLPIEEIKSPDGKSSMFRILAVAISNQIIDQYQRVAQNCGLEFVGFEPEAFSLIRSVNGGYKKILCLMDIGMRSSTISIVDNGILQTSHSINFSGNEMNQRLSEALGVDFAQAEEMKKTNGIMNVNPQVRDALVPSINMMIQEADRIFRDFYKMKEKKISKMIVSGSPIAMPGLIEYFTQQFSLEDGIEFANPFSKLMYPSALEGKLKQSGPRFAVAIGAAMRGFEL